MSYLKIWTETFQYIDTNYKISLFSFCIQILKIFLNDNQRPSYLYSYLISTDFIYSIFSKVFKSTLITNPDNADMLCHIIDKCYSLQITNSKFTLFFNIFKQQLANFTFSDIPPYFTLLVLLFYSYNEKCSLIPNFKSIHYCFILEPNITSKGLFNMFMNETKYNTQSISFSNDPDFGSLLDDLIDFYPDINNESQYYITRFFILLINFYEDTSFIEQYTTFFDFLKDFPLDDLNPSLVVYINEYCDSFHSKYSSAA